MRFYDHIPRSSVQLDLYAIAAELRAHPGQWGVIEKGPRGRLNGKASWWRAVGTAALPVGQFEYTLRKTKTQPDGATGATTRVKLLGRYVGDISLIDTLPTPH